MDYKSYQFSLSEWLIYFLLGICIDIMVSYLFYRSYIAFFLFLPAVGFFLNYQKKELCIKRKKELTIQFKEAIMSVSSSLSAGYSVENAFIEAVGDLINIYGREEIIVQEFISISGRIKANETLESIMQDLANRSGIEDIQDFTDVFVIAKRSGGDMVSIIRKTVDHIGEKIEVMREIDTLMSAKKMEQSIMSSIPFLIILYLNFGSSGFMNVLYGNITGIVIMTICLALYGIAFYMAKRIVSIEV